MTSFSHTSFGRSARFSFATSRLVFRAAGPESAPADGAESAPKKSPDAPEKGILEKKIGKVSTAKERARWDLDQSKKALERDRKFTSVYRHEGFKNGDARMLPEDIARLPKDLDPNLEYRAVGSVSTAPYNPEADHDSRWHADWVSVALQFMQLYADSKLFADMPLETMHDTLGAIDVLARLPINPDPKKVKKDLSRFAPDAVYGSRGAYNLLLALKRANAVVPDASGLASKVLYDLRVSRGGASKSRFTELGVYKQPVAAPAVKPASAVPTAPSSSPASTSETLVAPETPEEIFYKELDAFFDNTKHLSTIDGTITTQTVKGRERIGAEPKNVDFSDARYLILRDRDIFYVYPDAQKRQVRIFTTSRPTARTEELQKIPLGTVDVSDLKTKESRDDFSLGIFTVLDEYRNAQEAAAAEKPETAPSVEKKSE